MAKRYYISPIEGDGSSMETRFRVKIADYGVSYAIIMPTIAGKPKFTWALCLVETVNHSRLLADRDLQALPDFPLDVVLNAMQSSMRNSMLSKLSDRGVDTSSLTASAAFRNVVRTVGRHLEPTFSEDNFDVSE